MYKSIRWMKIRDVNREPLTFCTRHCTYKKDKIDVKGHQSGASCFLYVVLRVKKHKIDVKRRQSGALSFLYAVLRV
jgi:hypothetical protein